MTAPSPRICSSPPRRPPMPARGARARLPLAIPGPPPTFLLGWRGNLLRIARDPLGYLPGLHADPGDVAPLVRGGNGPTFAAVPDSPGTVAVFGPVYNREVLANPDLFHHSLLT